MVVDTEQKAKYETLANVLDERSWRMCLAAEAISQGYGGVSTIAKTAGVSRTTIHTGIVELKNKTTEKMSRHAIKGVRIRKPGGGRKPVSTTNKALLRDLDLLVDPMTRGDPMTPLRWTCKSTTKLAAELKAMGHEVSQPTVWRLLVELDYSMQSNRKTREGADHPDRNEQFEFINSSVKRFMASGRPVISVDTKKKELVGNFKNPGQEWQRKGQPTEVNTHDFPDSELGKSIPYGVYDINRNEGWVSVGVTHDTAEFAVETIRRWWIRMGQQVYPHAKHILITADGGGSNGYRVRLWKIELQKLADELGMTLHVRHFPPGTSKWNKIEHRMFCHITENWRARPLDSMMAVVNLIGNTKTAKGLKIRAELDEQEYETGKKVDDQQLESISLKRCRFHGEWNYKILPSKMVS